MLLNDIAVEQNSNRKLSLIAAKTRLYSLAQRVQVAQAVLPLANAIAWPILLTSREEMKVWSVLAGFAIPLIDAFVFEPLQKNWKSSAASIQELFDCELLQIPWNYLKAGQRPSEEQIAEGARSITKRGYDPHWKDWYTFNFSDVPMFLARIICQRSNCWWDSKLRRRYANTILVIVILLLVFALAFAVAKGFTLEAFITGVIAPIFPLCIWGFKESTRQRSTATEGKQLLARADQLWSKAAGGLMTEAEASSGSRSLQDDIFARRIASPVNPSWLYSQTRSDYQELMVAGANKLISSYREGTNTTRNGNG